MINLTKDNYEDLRSKLKGAGVMLVLATWIDITVLNTLNYIPFNAKPLCFVLGVIVIIFFMRFIWLAILFQFFNSKMIRITDNVAEDIKYYAMDHYGDDWRWVLIECQESHIPGDCPLCGAE